MSVDEATKEMTQLEKHFSKQTSVKILARLRDHAGFSEMVFNGQNSSDFLELVKKSKFTACFINRFIITPDTSQEIPKDKKRLRVSGHALSWLLTIFEASLSFVSSMLTLESPEGLNSCGLTDKKGRPVYTCWYTIPVRTASACLDKDGTHALSVASNTQVDSSGYMHLHSIDHDVRPSRISVHCRYDSKSCAMICVDFQDGRLPEFAEEPYNRAREAASGESPRPEGKEPDPLDVHATLLLRCAGWWYNTLYQVKRQLIHSEITLLEESMKRVDSIEPDLEASARHLAQKKMIHAIMSHLQRYFTELGVLKQIAADLQSADTDISRVRNGSSAEKETPIIESPPKNPHLEILIKRVSALEAFTKELDQKADTVMNLLTQVVNWRNDILLVNGGGLTGKLLLSSRKQATASRMVMLESQQMARDMRKDSTSMKTIALLTMFFLPATSFAAVLSMSFFNQQEWLNDPGKVWVWVILTALSTALSVVIYTLSTRKELRKELRKNLGGEEAELESVDIILGS
ncbi:hypothetical protein B0T16DRAFT_390708 [Cercophora newfieldiana]|uniref:Uncharacterized protein n=1 Tax=Cercophora newfieldiana TaxID=92897 RepID=A0AA40CQY9_9PEZI|nr:hypothetical protein B0T16DRAFT_390708 [Cercophora newfieldiana]